ncbi:MAG: hypothetical protein Q9165_002360 [Trypethelium subeluteriae]
MLLADSMSMNSGVSGAKYDSLHYGGSSQDGLYQHHDEVLERMRFRDEKLKYRIRLLKLFARLLSLLLSLTTLSPLSLTFHKFLTTKDVFRTVDGQSRTAWNANTKLWPMYMYLALAAIATAFNLAIMLAYCWGVRQANRASTVAGWFSGAVIVGHVVVWAVGASLYRVGKDEGEHARDLWGWTCGLGAQKIQNVFAQEINFGRYCNVQVSRSLLCLDMVVLLDGDVRGRNDKRLTTLIGRAFRGIPDWRRPR